MNSKTGGHTDFFYYTFEGNTGIQSLLLHKVEHNDLCEISIKIIHKLTLRLVSNCFE